MHSTALLLFLLGLVGWCVPAAGLSLSAVRRGLSGAVYFGIGMLLGPVLSIAMLVSHVEQVAPPSYFTNQPLNH